MSEYWGSRNELRYYGAVDKLLQAYSPGEMLLDVGCHDTPMVLRGDFVRRVTVDLHPRPALEGVEAIVSDWMQVMLPRAAVVMSLQTLEHLPDTLVFDFARKLRQGGDTIIVSVPFMWHAGCCRHHCQDPIDQAKLDGFMQCEPLNSEVITEDNGVRRLICVYPSLSSIVATNG